MQESSFGTGILLGIRNVVPLTPLLLQPYSKISPSLNLSQSTVNLHFRISKYRCYNYNLFY